jgi:hypothetical protein
MTVTTATAARIARATVKQIRTWCRNGIVAATKAHGRWVIDVASLRTLIARLRPAPRPRPADHYRPGENTPAKTGRAARTRVGHHMSVGRRHDVLDALVSRTNGDQITAAAYLAELGADADFIKSYASPFGKAIARVYREVGREPERIGLARVGRRLVPVFAYAEADRQLLDAAAQAYPRTAALLATH